MSEKYRTFGEKLKAVRENQGICIEDAANRADLTPEQWELIENAPGRSVAFSFAMLWDFAFALDVTVIELLETT